MYIEPILDSTPNSSNLNGFSVLFLPFHCTWKSYCLLFLHVQHSDTFFSKCFVVFFVLIAYPSSFSFRYNRSQMILPTPGSHKNLVCSFSWILCKVVLLLLLSGISELLVKSLFSSSNLEFYLTCRLRSFCHRLTLVLFSPVVILTCAKFRAVRLTT